MEKGDNRLLFYVYPGTFSRKVAFPLFLAVSFFRLIGGVEAEDRDAACLFLEGIHEGVDHRCDIEGDDLRKEKSADHRKSERSS